MKTNMFFLSLALMTVVCSGPSHAKPVSKQNNIVRTGPAIRLGDAYLTIATCMYDQMQKMSDQLQVNQDSVILDPKQSWVEEHSKYEFNDDTGIGKDEEITRSNNTFEIAPQVMAFGTWQQGQCHDDYATLGFNNDMDGRYFYISKDHVCSNSKVDNDRVPNLVAPEAAVPAIIYSKQDRSITYDNVGNRTEPFDLIKNLTFVPAKTSGTVYLVNSNTQHPSNVTFDTDAYSACLKTNLGF